MVGGSVANLKRELEQLFPGKWLSGGEVNHSLKTGLASIDFGLSRGLPRRRITEWVGTTSSGKTTVLRTICANWLKAGLNIIYIDTFDRLIASDWCFPEEGGRGKFWVLKSNMDKDPGSRRDFYRDALWACGELIRSRAFDVVVLDLGEKNSITSNLYARLQRALDRSKTSLIVLRDDDSSASDTWGSDLRFAFGFSAPIHCQLGLTGVGNVATILPTIKGFIVKDGMTKGLEVSVNSHVSNRLFTHPQIPDRRSSKTRARAQG
ncbi:MAG: hypothetical protein KGS72_22015 [Cyanobacteria bacterium REEB67]|nr:hypothetical protein [Cyanobacteria bacterium REEB67]